MEDGWYYITREDNYSGHDGHYMRGYIDGYPGYRAWIDNFNHNNIPYRRDMEL
jgi:hypothetical protein